MNRIILTSALLLSLAGVTTFAQATTPQAPTQTQRHVHNPHKAAIKMSRKLGLSQDQTAKLEPILAERQQKMRALRVDSTLTDIQKKDQRRQIQQSTRTELSGVLTPDQMQQLRIMQKAHRHNAKTGA